MIKVYDSKQRKLVALEPRDESRIAMYACGPTVYNLIHIGNARTLVWYDMVRRYLVYRGYDVTYVMNYTDVDDKIIERANIEGIPTEGVTRKYTQAFEADMSALGTEPATLIVRATDHIGDMVVAIQGLIDKDVAYEVDGDVWFAVERFAGYGGLSGRSLDDMRAGDRIEPSAGKRSPLDFALWKSAKEGEPSWPSPWGEGRPGWHIECSVMSTKYLGMSFDIHGGGLDLIFPHHENELAQAEGLHGGTFVRNWVHAGLVQMESEKMSKSLGNVVLARDVIAHYGGEVGRYWMLASSLRSQAVFSDDSLDDAARSLERWRTFLEAARHALGDEAPAPSGRAQRPLDGPGPEGGGAEFIARFIAAMDDDFNSAQAFAAVHDLVSEGNRLVEGAQRREEGERKSLAGLLEAFLELMGVLNLKLDAKADDSQLVGGLVEYLLELREAARKEKAFERADEIRSRLTDLGVAIDDTPAGPRWRVSGAS
ncbi:MAG: cysteine--tRNA ligase [Actinomycetota bacterium]|nr:cysteine--tRNA ligase [Actinomycetota bacterium]